MFHSEFPFLNEFRKFDHVLLGAVFACAFKFLHDGCLKPVGVNSLNVTNINTGYLWPKKMAKS